MSNRTSRFTLRSTRVLLRLVGLLAVILVVTLACSLPFLAGETPVPPSATVEEEEGAVVVSTTEPPPAPPPTPTPQPLPPSLVESDPSPGFEIPLQGSITFYFNQPMDQASVEAAYGGLAGKFEWADETTVVFSPDEPLSPSTEILLTLDTSARATNGLSLKEPVTLTYKTVGYLRLTQRIPAPGTENVDPTSAIVAAFNRPVVPLGSDPESLSPAILLEPTAEGRGEWINTSTYVFYPEPSLAGGTAYTASLDPELTGVDGSPLAGVDTWSFTTDPPHLLLVEPEDEARDVRLDTDITLTFNQPMSTGSVEASFQVLDSGSNAVPGEFTWSDDSTVLTYTPSILLRRDSVYTIYIDEGAQASGGTQIGYEVRSSLHTVPSLHVIGSEPLEGAWRNIYEGVTVYFNGPIQSHYVLQFITLVPEPDNLRSFADDDDRTLRLFGNFTPETDYTLIISPNLPDAWSGRLGQEFMLHFNTQPLDPQLTLMLGTDVLYLTPQDPSLHVQATNLSQLSISIGRVSLDEFLAMLSQGGYELRQTYQPADQRTIWKDLDLPPNQSQIVEVPLAAEDGSLEPGLYFLRLNVQVENIYAGPYLLVVGNTHLTLKLSATDALLWAVDLRDGTPVGGAPVTIYADEGVSLATGETDAEGVMRTSIPVSEDFFAPKYAVLGQPGEDDFALTLSHWSQGLEGWDFGLPTDYAPPQLEAYLYTDRPIYRPGQTVFFRAVLREAYNGRYELPEQSNLTLILADDFGEEGVIETFDLPLSEFGTAHGAYTLPVDIAPGYYRLDAEGARGSGVTFQVAEYRKPEINLGVSFESEQGLAGDSLVATVTARYFFDAPAGNIPVKFSVYKGPSYFYLPGYQVGAEDTRWLLPFPRMYLSLFGELVVEDEAETDPEGLLKIEFVTDPEDSRQQYTVEVTAQDESGLPVSNRASIDVNSAAIYIGVRPDAWAGQAGRAIGYEVLVVDWDQNPAGVRSLRANFNKVVWEWVEPASDLRGEFPTYEPHYTLIGSTDFTTGEDGLARVAFTPPEPGTYQLEVTGLEPDGEGALTQVTLWVGGPGQAVWPSLPNQRLRLTADQEAYQPGQAAQVFVPNPFGEGTPALVTIERGTILRYQVLTLGGSGTSLSLPLDGEDAPNVYVSVTLLGKKADGTPDFRQGYVNLPVEPIQQTLNVALTSEPQRAGPGDQVAEGTQFQVYQGQRDDSLNQERFKHRYHCHTPLAYSLISNTAPALLPCTSGK